MTPCFSTTTTTTLNSLTTTARCTLELPRSPGPSPPQAHHLVLARRSRPWTPLSRISSSKKSPSSRCVLAPPPASGPLMPLRAYTTKTSLRAHHRRRGRCVSLWTCGQAARAHLDPPLRRSSLHDFPNSRSESRIPPKSTQRRYSSISMLSELPLALSSREPFPT